MEEFFRQEEPNLNRVRKRVLFVKERLRFSLSEWLGRTLIMQNMANAEFVFGENSRVKRYYVPVGKRVARFEAKRSFLSRSPIRFDLVFDCHAEAVGKAKLKFLGIGKVGAIKGQGVALKYRSRINSPRWQHIAGDQIREAAARKGPVGRRRRLPVPPLESRGLAPSRLRPSRRRSK